MTTPDEGRADALDRAWDAQPAPEPPAQARNADRDQEIRSTIRRFHAADDLPAPDPAFLRSLKEDLMRAHPMSQAATLPRSVARATPAHRFPATWNLPPRPVPPQFGRPSPLLRAAEFAAFAALVAAIALGTLVGRGIVPGRGQAGPTAAPLPLAALASPGPAVAAGAAMPLGNAARTSEVAGPGPLRPPQDRWQADIVAGAVGEVWEAPVIVDGVAYFTAILRDPAQDLTGEDAVVAYDLESQRPLWQATESVLDFEAVSAPAVADGLLFLGIGGRASAFSDEPPTGVARIGATGALVALDARTGAERWRADVGSPVYPSPVIAGGVVYAVSSAGAVHAFDAATGAERWRTPVAAIDPTIGEALLGEPAVGDGIVAVVENYATLHALDLRTGQERWRTTASSTTHTPIIAQGSVVIASESTASDPDGVPPSSLLAFDAATGSERWSIALADGYPSQPVAGSGLVVVVVDEPGDDGSRLVAVDALTGVERWSSALDQRLNQGLVLAAGAIYFTGYDFGPIPEISGILDVVGLGGSSDLYALEAATGTPLWQIGLADEVAEGPLAIDGGLAYLFGSGYEYGGVGTLHAFGAAP